MPTGRTLEWRRRYRKQIDDARQVRQQLSMARDEVPHGLSADEAYVFRERLGILCGDDLEPDKVELWLADKDVERFRRETRGELV